MRRTFAALACAVSLLGTSGVLGTAATARAAGGTWHDAPKPALWPGSGLMTVRAYGAKDVWTTGFQGELCWYWSIAGFGAGTVGCSTRNPAVAHWNGVVWKSYGTTGFTGDGELTSVSAGSPKDAWVAGGRHLDDLGNFAGGTYLGHSTGGDFTEVTPPAECASRPIALASGPATTWMVCGQTGTIYRVTASGTAVSFIPASTPADFVAPVSVVSDTDAWTTTGDALLHWDGTAWNTVPSPTSDRLSHVLARTPSDVWAVSPGQGLWHWNGSTWSSAPVPAGNVIEAAIADDGTLWGYTPRYPQALLWHYDGTSWQSTTPPTTGFAGINALTAVPGTGALWAVGDNEADVANGPAPAHAAFSIANT